MNNDENYINYDDFSIYLIYCSSIYLELINLYSTMALQVSTNTISHVSKNKNV